MDCPLSNNVGATSLLWAQSPLHVVWWSGLSESRVLTLGSLPKLWLGHSKHSVTDFYAGGLKNDLAWRREWCDHVGLGFSVVGLRGLQNAVPIDSEKVA
jgi:hypothetical protein